MKSTVLIALAGLALAIAKPVSETPSAVALTLNDDTFVSSSYEAASLADRLNVEGGELDGELEELPDDELGEGEAMDGAETVVFRPLFAHRQREARRRPRSLNSESPSAAALTPRDENLLTSETTYDATSPAKSLLAEGDELDGELDELPDNELGEGEAMDGAEAVVFRPLFAHRQRQERRRERALQNRHRPHSSRNVPHRPYGLRPAYARPHEEKPLQILY